MSRISNRLCMLLLPVAIIAIFIEPVSAQFRQDVDNQLWIEGGWIFASTGDQRVPNPGLMIRDGVIVSVGPSTAAVDLSPESIIRLEGEQTILPGMFDLHAHYNYDLVDQGRAEEVRYSSLVFLANGVTATWSAGEYFPERVIAQRDRIDAGRVAGPRLFASGPYMGGFRCEYSVKTAEDECIAWPNDITEQEIRAEVDAWAGRGVTSLKIKQATAEETRIIIDQAHKHGMTTAGHLYNYDYEYDVSAIEAVGMGLNRLEHNLTLSSDDSKQDEADEVIALLIRDGVFFDPNIQMYGGINLRKELPGLVWTDESRYLTPYARDLLEKRGPPPPESEPDDFNQRLVELRKFHRAGGADLLIVGTDEPVYTSLLAGFAYHRELKAMVWAGIPAADVLKAATINGARAMGVDDRLGTIEEGKLADLVIVDGDPLADINNARNVVYVIRDGEVHSPVGLLKQVENKIGPKGPDDHEDWKLVVPPLRD